MRQSVSTTINELVKCIFIEPRVPTLSKNLRILGFLFMRHSVFWVVSAVGELEQRTKEKMEAAKKRTSQEIMELKDKLKASRENINHLKAEIRKLEEDGDHKDH